MPRYLRFDKTAFRVGGWFSPMPPVKVMASTPSMTATKAPIYLCILCTNMSKASFALLLCSSALYISRMSLDKPEIPRSPLLLFRS